MLKFSKSVLVIAALGLGSVAAQAATTDWNVHGALQFGVGFQGPVGAFTDYFLFEINPASTVSSTAVANNLGDGVVLNILNGQYSVWDAGTDGVVGGVGAAADTKISTDFLFNGLSGNLTNSVNLTAGNYFYMVTGNAVGMTRKLAALETVSELLVTDILPILELLGTINCALVAVTEPGTGAICPVPLNVAVMIVL